MKKIISLLAGAALLALVGTTGCAQKAGSGEDMYKRIPAKTHQQQFPNGHDGSKNCYYEEKSDMYFCGY